MCALGLGCRTLHLICCNFVEWSLLQKYVMVIGGETATTNLVNQHNP